MSASLGAKTYTAVTWASGDYITEAKMDNMTDNDQAYDSHAAQGLLLNNEKSFAAKDAGDVARNLLRINASSQLEIGDSGLVGVPPINFLANNWIRQTDFDSDAIPTDYDSLSGGNFTSSSSALGDTGLANSIVTTTYCQIISIAVITFKNDTAGAGAYAAIEINGNDYGKVQAEKDTAHEHGCLVSVAMKSVGAGTYSIKLRGARLIAGTVSFVDARCHLLSIAIPWSGI